jgi:protein TonB
MKRVLLALLVAILVNLGIFFALALLNKKQPKSRELPQVARIHYTPLEIMAAPSLPPPPAPPSELARPPEPAPQAATALPPVQTPVADSATAPKLDMPVHETPAPQPEAPAPLPPLPTDLPGIELPEIASPPSLIPAPPAPPEPIAESAPPPPEPPPVEPPPEPETDIVFTPDGFIAVENITATLPSAPAYIEPPPQPLAPPPSRPPSGPSRAPQPIDFAEPVYPPAARRHGIEGQVTIRLHIGLDGIVSDIEVMDVQGHDSFRSAVLTAVRKWRFTPALENGIPVTAWGERTIIFDLD